MPMRLLTLVILAPLVALTLACTKDSKTDTPTAPTVVAPTTPTVVTPPPSPTVKFDVAYYTNEITTDPDHFRASICGAAAGSCRSAFTSNTAARTPGTITLSAALAPGTYTATVELYFADRLIDFNFSAAPGSAAGGVERNSLRFKDSNTTSVNSNAFRQCGVTTTFTRRPDLAPLNVSQTFVSFDFTVTAGSTSSTC